VGDRPAAAAGQPGQQDLGDLAPLTCIYSRVSVDWTAGGKVCH
jgi:hypothetical protein